ncbi:MerR family transcriptional regulator [Methylocaldum sp. BRCS4]|jgi:chaperone modulatory protein CbpM|uniref:chaperone modulator CbpM n=2 Tax=Methylocaldum TaxID=73778 RepID=UPI00098BAF8D|nr:chaperone modulator CbpM [Methylocaldum sp. 14B]MVF23899.1 MerR family transcriptional regulator [Methylocaldum sp. BRCS4]
MTNRTATSSSGMVLDETIKLSLVDVCEACRVDAESIFEMVNEGIVDPEGSEPMNWQFNTAALRRLQTALHLQRDLGVNLPGAALALDLLEELEALRRRAL